MSNALLRIPSQADRRRTMIAEEQHGRRWEYVIETSTGEPCSTFVPHFNAPWYPDQKYIIRDPNNLTKLYIDYPALLRDAQISHKDYESALRQAAKHLPGIEDIEAAVKNPPPLLLEIVGTGPEPIQLAYAASIGNPWALGFDPVVPKWAEPFVRPREENLAMLFPEIEGGDGKAPGARSRRTAPQPAPELTEEEKKELLARMEQLGGSDGIEGGEAPPEASGRRGRNKAAAAAATA